MREVIVVVLSVLSVCHGQVASSRAEIRITVANPSDEEQCAEVKHCLPAWVTTNDVIDSDGLNIRRDELHGNLYLEKRLVLPPRDVIAFRPVFVDVWTVPRAVLLDLQVRLREAVVGLGRIQKAANEYAREERGIAPSNRTIASTAPAMIAEALQADWSSIASNETNQPPIDSGIDASAIAMLEQYHSEVDSLKARVHFVERALKRFPSEQGEWWRAFDELETLAHSPLISVEMFRYPYCGPGEKDAQHKLNQGHRGHSSKARRQ
jgi:hypothetical protein